MGVVEFRVIIFKDHDSQIRCYFTRPANTRVMQGGTEGRETFWSVSISRGWHPTYAGVTQGSAIS